MFIQFKKKSSLINLNRQINKITQKLYKNEQLSFKEKHDKLIEELKKIYNEQHSIKDLHKRLTYITETEKLQSTFVPSILTGLISSLIFLIGIDDKFGFNKLLSEPLSYLKTIISDGHNELSLIILITIVVIIFSLLLFLFVLIPIILLVFMLFKTNINTCNDLLLSYETEIKIIKESIMNNGNIKATKAPQNCDDKISKGKLGIITILKIETFSIILSFAFSKIFSEILFHLIKILSSVQTSIKAIFIIVFYILFKKLFGCKWLQKIVSNGDDNET